MVHVFKADSFLSLAEPRVSSEPRRRDCWWNCQARSRHKKWLGCDGSTRRTPNHRGSWVPANR